MALQRIYALASTCVVQRPLAKVCILHSTTTGTGYRYLTIGVSQSCGISGKGVVYIKRISIEQIRQLSQRWISFNCGLICSLILCFIWITHRGTDNFWDKAHFYWSLNRISRINNRRYLMRSNEACVLKISKFKHDTFGMCVFATCGLLVRSSLSKELWSDDEIKVF